LSNLNEINSLIQMKDICQFTYKSEVIKFYCPIEEDHIQSIQRKGQFYEIEELELMRSYIPDGSIILDVGSNVGNHIVFFNKYCNPDYIFSIEPNLFICSILRENLQLNFIGDVQVYCGLALSSEVGSGDVSYKMTNLGGARIKENVDGNVAITTGDLLLGEQRVDFIKFDAEDHDIRSIRGMKFSIMKNKPVIFIEILDERFHLFIALLEEFNYRIEKEYKRYQLVTNYIILPKS